MPAHTAPMPPTSHPEDDLALDILLVEDALLDECVCRQMLEKDSPWHRVEGVFYVKDAIAAVERQPQRDCVLLDLQLPDGKGQEVMEAILRLNPEIPIIVLTATQDERLGLDLIAQGAEDYLIKGQFNQRQLIRSIYYAIGRKLSRLRPHTSSSGQMSADI